MIKLFFGTILVLFLVPVLCNAQRGGFIDNFEDGSPDIILRNGDKVKLWDTDSPGTYKLKENNGILQIEYSKNNGSGSNDCFSLNPPRRINFSSNPHIKVSV